MAIVSPTNADCAICHPWSRLMGSFFDLVFYKVMRATRSGSCWLVAGARFGHSTWGDSREAPVLRTFTASEGLRQTIQGRRHSRPGGRRAESSPTFGLRATNVRRQSPGAQTPSRVWPDGSRLFSPSTSMTLTLIPTKPTWSRSGSTSRRSKCSRHSTIRCRSLKSIL
jgi:hypothetical protein